MTDRWSHDQMLAAIASGVDRVSLPVGRKAPEWEHNARVLTDLFADGLVRADVEPLKDGAGAFVAYPGLRLTDSGKRRLAATSTSSVEVATPAEVAEVERVLLVIRRVEESGALDSDQAAVVHAERETLEAQVRSPRPNRGVIRAALVGIRWVADAVGSGVLGNAVFEVLRQLGPG